MKIQTNVEINEVKENEIPVIDGYPLVGEY